MMSIIETIQRLIECHERSPMEIMENILLFIENISLTANECRLLDEILLNYMKEHNITQSDEVFQLYLRRMSFTYLPGITKLNINRLKQQTNGHQQDSIPAASTNELISSNPTESIDLSEERISGIERYSEHDSLLLAINYAPPGYRFTCTMKRKKTALQTSYRLDIDGCTSLSPNDGALLRSDSMTAIDPLLSLQLSHKGFVLCAKKQNRNLGLSSSYQIWGPSGWKEWKEKTAIGKIIRNNGIYCGHLTDFVQESFVVSSASQYLPYLPVNRRCISVKVLSGGLDKLLHVVAAIQVEPLVNKNENEMNSTSASTSTPTPPRNDSTSPETTQQPKTTNNSTDIDIENDSEVILQSIVESICSTKSDTSQLSQPLPPNTLLLQSRRPKKLKSTDQQLLSPSYYTIQYGENGRVRNPSRKNIVMEKMKYDSTSHTVFNNIFHSSDDLKSGLSLLEPEWMSNEPVSTPLRVNGNGYFPSVDLPILQCGKMSEDVFSLDFTVLSPFQVINFH